MPAFGRLRPNRCQDSLRAHQPTAEPWHKALVRKVNPGEDGRPVGNVYGWYTTDTQNLLIWFGVPLPTIDCQEHFVELTRPSDRKPFAKHSVISIDRMDFRACRGNGHKSSRPGRRTR